MTSSLLFDFTVNKTNNTVNVKRTFAAERDLVWAAWTTPEILDQWWAPKPYRTQTKIMDFREGGMWLYAMISPTDDVHWGKNDYLAIVPRESFTGLDAFCDEHGTTIAGLPRTHWVVAFSDAGAHTLVTITSQYESLEDLEKIIAMGFQEGFTMALQNLDQYLEAQRTD